MKRVRLRLRTETTRPDDAGSLVHVVIRDTTLEDTLHPTIAETTATLVNPGDSMDVEIGLPETALDPRNRYSVWAHVDLQGVGEIRPGDLITTQNVPVSIEDVGSEPIEVPLTRV